MCVAKKLNLVDMYGIGLMLEHLVAEGNITCEERDRVILRIARENDQGISSSFSRLRLA